jgi:signal transduction histidine kinase
MRRRLLLSTLLVAVTAVVLLGVPLTIVMSRLVSNEASRELTHDTTLAQRAMVREAGTPHPDYQAVYESLPDDDHLAILEDGHQVAAFGTWPAPHQVLRRTAKVGDYTLVVETSKPADAVVGPLALVAGLALVSVLVAVGLAVLQVRRFTRPLEELAESAARLGSGDARPMGRRYGLPELDQVAEGLDGSARRLSDLLAAEREFASDASHQLRTPLTALSMRLEEMIAASDDPEAVRAEGEAALSQTERLADVVSQLLGRTRSVGATAPTLIGVDDVLAQQVAEWDPAFRRANRKLEVAGDKGLRAYATPGTLAQVVATLLDNALAHGGGTVTIRTSQTAKSVVIEVRDEGHGVPEALVSRIFERNVSGRPHGTGLGLALARTMASAEGGRVVLVRPRPAVFAVFLPLADPESPQDRPVVSGPA